MQQAFKLALCALGLAVVAATGVGVAGSGSPGEQKAATTLPQVGAGASSGRGRLVLVGSGIRGIGQFTLEGLAHVKAADIVFYAVADPATELFIEENARKAVDLYDLYGNGKHRRETYVQMAEKMLQQVRLGKFVVGVFYGHPGIFVSPGHRALQIAWLEGYDAEMLPGVSAIDCLSADLSVDPSRPGLQILEATDMLLRERTLFTDGHVVLFQVGSVGDVRFNFTGFTDAKFEVLATKLHDIYGEDHKLVLYVAPQFSVVQPQIVHLRMRDLFKAEVQRKITGISTFYIPPRHLRGANPLVGKQLGISVTSKEKPLAGPFRPGTPYTSKDMAAVRALESHSTPEGYRKTRAHRAWYETLRELAMNPHELMDFRRNPKLYVQKLARLNKKERGALLSQHSGRIRTSMKLSEEEMEEDIDELEEDGENVEAGVHHTEVDVEVDVEVDIECDVEEAPQAARVDIELDIDADPFEEAPQAATEDTEFAIAFDPVETIEETTADEQVATDAQQVTTDEEQRTTNEERVMAEDIAFQL